jgi:chitinase
MNIALIACGALSANAIAAEPSAPSIDWMELNYSMITVPETLDYKGVSIIDELEIPVKWSKWSGVDGTKIKILLDGNVVYERDIFENAGSQTGTENLVFTEGGNFNLTVEMCNIDGCTPSSNSKQIVIADSIGSHLSPLEMKVNDPRFPIEMTNKSYQNTTGKMVAAYAAEWSVYRVEGMDYYIDNIPAENLTHLIYGFVGITGPNESFKELNPTGYNTFQSVSAGMQDFELAPPDPWAAYQKTVGNQVQSDKIKGNYGQMMALKNRYPDLKIIPSIGGWTLSDPFYFMGDDTKRATFVESARQFLRTWKFFDGIDIDWEFPGVKAANPNLGDPLTDGDTYVKLMRDLREMLDEEGALQNRHYELSSAINVGYDKLDKVDYADAVQYMDFIMMMSYDYFGAWDTTKLGHQTGVYPSDFRADENTQKYNLRTGVNLLKAQGVPASKLVAGIAMYGRGWTGVTHEAGTHHMTGTATGPAQPSGSFKLEPGTIMYANIAQWVNEPSWEYHYDTVAQAPYIYNPTTGDLISYDDDKSIQAKADIVMSEGMAGMFAWEIDTDNGDILNWMHESLGHPLADGSNSNPNVNAGLDAQAYPLDLVNLVGTASDSDGDTLSYLWTQKAGTLVVLSDENTLSASFTVPDLTVSETLVFELLANDGKGGVSKDTVSILIVVEGENNPPTVNAGLDRSVNSSESNVQLDGSLTSDADGDTLTYSWTQVSGSPVSISDNLLVTGYFDAPVVNADETLVFKLTVSDNGVDFYSDDVSVTIMAPLANSAPVVTIPSLVNFDENSSFTLTANAVDSDGDSLSYTWSIPTGLVSVINDNSVVLSSNGVDSDTNYSVSVTVSDGTDNVAKTISVKVTNVTSGGTVGTYDPSAIYNAGDEASVYDEGIGMLVTYAAKHWVKGVSPSRSATEWSLVTDIEFPWGADIVYVGGSEVNHEGQRYRARYWTKGDNPASSNVWVNIGPAN